MRRKLVFPLPFSPDHSQQRSWLDRHADVGEQPSFPATAAQCDGLEHIRRNPAGTEEKELPQRRIFMGRAVRERFLDTV